MTVTTWISAAPCPSKVVRRRLSRRHYHPTHNTRRVVHLCRKWLHVRTGWIVPFPRVNWVRKRSFEDPDSFKFHRHSKIISSAKSKAAQLSSFRLSCFDRLDRVLKICDPLCNVSINDNDTSGLFGPRDNTWTFTFRRSILCRLFLDYPWGILNTGSLSLPSFLSLTRERKRHVQPAESRNTTHIQYSLSLLLFSFSSRVNA